VFYSSYLIYNELSNILITERVRAPSVFFTRLDAFSFSAECPRYPKDIVQKSSSLLIQFEAFAKLLIPRIFVAKYFCFTEINSKYYQQ
jgi:hypothetical protein